MEYDGLGRMLSRSVTTPDGEGDGTYAYSYYLTGNRESMSGGGTSAAYTYDDMGRLIQESETGNIQKIYDYDASGNRKQFTLTKGGATDINTAYVYDKMDRLHQVKENNVLKATYTYDDNGNRKTLTYDNGNSTEYKYNLANQVKQLKNKQNTAVLSQYDYTYFLDGNQQTKTETVTGKATAYGYDDLGRLVSEIETAGDSISYTYDDYNNRKTMTKNGVETGYEYTGTTGWLLKQKPKGMLPKQPDTPMTQMGTRHTRRQKSCSPIPGNWQSMESMYWERIWKAVL